MNPLIKKVPGHLFQFEEKIFGMTLTQLLSDVAALFSLMGVTSSVSLLTRLAIIAPLMLMVLVLVHGKMRGYTMLYWLYLLVRFRFQPRHTVRDGKGASVQECWIQFNELTRGVAGMVRGTQAMYWAAFEIESKYAVRYLAETDQVRLYGRFKQFLDGLSFPVKFISLVSSLDATHDPTLMAQQQVMASLADTPRLQQLQGASLKHQQAVAQHSTVTRHFVIVSASTSELARERASRFSLGHAPTITNAQVKNELKNRVSILSKTLAQLDVQATFLDDASLLSAYAACLAPGHHIASNDSRDATFADRLAPSAVELSKDAVMVEMEGEKRYMRYYEVTGFAPELACGWLEEITSLALPLVIMTDCEPLASRVMIRRLEGHLIKLESKTLADQKAIRVIRANQKVEAEEVRTVIDDLAKKLYTIFGVQMVIGLHASSEDALEKRANFLLSHLRDLQVQTRELIYRHDIGWQACLPARSSSLDSFINLPSTALSTFMNWSTGTVGTTTGAVLGTTGSGFTRRLVYFNPWDEQKRLPNPHVVICGESGMGKSWLAKTLILGLLCTKTADAVVLDRDGDYDEIHSWLRNESQRFNLAGACPMNLLDIPYGPADVDLDDPVDLLSEFIDNHLLVGLALLYGEPLSKPQEAFLMHAARAAYAKRSITTQAIQSDPNTLLFEPPIFADLLAAMREVPASTESLRLSLLERFENVAYLFPGQTTVSINCPLTIFNIKKLDEKWYPLMMYVVQNFLQRHRALRRDDRYLAYVVEEASYMLKHPAGKRYLESGSRGFRKLGIAQFTLSQHPADFLEEGQVIISNAGTCFFLGMQRYAAQKLGLAEELERVLEQAISGHAVMRCGREYAAIEVAKLSPLHQAICTTDPRERRLLQKRGEEK